MGFEPINAGVLPTPALAFASEVHALPAIMVTGSHIPFDRNGIKFYGAKGEITKADEQRILACPVSLTDEAPSVLLPPDPAILALYRDRYTSAFGPESFEGLKLGVYEHSSAARDVLHEVLRPLGATTVSLGRSDSFVPIDTEAVRDEDRALARRWAMEHGLDAILTTDGDADRPLVADETGEWLRGDIFGILCARAVGAHTVVTPVSSNTALEACRTFASTIRTRIGSPHVIAAMAAATGGPVVGYEANGGFLLGSDVILDGRLLRALCTRYALLPMLTLLATARHQHTTLSRLVAALPARRTFSDRLQDIDTASCWALLATLDSDPSRLASLVPMELGPPVSLDKTDGIRATFPTGDIVHLRLSGNAPELRCYTEANSGDRAATLCRDVLAKVSSELKNAQAISPKTN